MSNTTIIMKRHDTLPNLTYTLVDQDGELIDITESGVTVSMSMKGISNGNLVVDTKPCIIEDASESIIRYEWDVEDTDVAGDYLVEFEVQYLNNKKLSVPTTDSLSVVLLEDFNNA